MPRRKRTQNRKTITWTFVDPRDGESKCRSLRTTDVARANEIKDQINEIKSDETRWFSPAPNTLPEVLEIWYGSELVSVDVDGTAVRTLPREGHAKSWDVVPDQKGEIAIPLERLPPAYRHLAQDGVVRFRQFEVVLTEHVGE